MDTKTGQRPNRKKRIFVAVLVLLAIVALIFAVVLAQEDTPQENQPQIINKSTLEKIINVSDLSTFEAVYNGIAEVMNGDKPEQIDYYVAYDAKVKAGIDFENVKIEVDDENKVIVVTLPEIKITDVEVDITSLDYIFLNEDANTPTVSEEAYRKCIEDVQNESNSENAIFELAEQNARNIVEALLRPFVTQLDENYQLRIE